MLHAVLIGIREMVVVDRPARTQYLFDHHGQSGHHLLKHLIQRLSDEFRAHAPSDASRGAMSTIIGPLSGWTARSNSGAKGTGNCAVSCCGCDVIAL